MSAISNGMRIVALCHVATLATFGQQYTELCPPLFGVHAAPFTVAFDLPLPGHRAVFALAASLALSFVFRPRSESSTTWRHCFFVIGWLMLYYLQRQAMLSCPQFIGNYGWHWQLAETTLLCAAASLPPRPSAANVWLFRWLAFRVMWGAGMSKLGSHASACWKWPALSCTETHYETQPLPSPLAFFLHRLPVQAHQFEVLVNHVAELAAPYLLWAPWPVVANAGAAVIIGYLVAIAISGSYATIQLITIAPLVAAWQSPGFVVLAPAPNDPQTCDDASGKAKKSTISQAPLPVWRTIVDCCFLALIALRSIEPVRESFSPSPWLHTYDSFYTVNAYGVFGFVNTRRFGLGLAASASCSLPNGSTLKIVEGRSLDLPCLPGNPMRMPCAHVMFPPGFHRMLDWDVWIHTTASLEALIDSGRVGGASAHQQKLQLVPQSLRIAVSRLLEGNDETARALFDSPTALAVLLGPDASAHAPCSRVNVSVRSVLFNYSFASVSQPFLGDGKWWQRRRVQGVAAEIFHGHLFLPERRAPSWLGGFLGWFYHHSLEIYLLAVLAILTLFRAGALTKFSGLIFTKIIVLVAGSVAITSFLCFLGTGII